jgi:predicted amidophosphoribosyltransferase
VEDEANVAARDAEIDVARTKAEEAVRSGERATDGDVVCEACGARVQPAKLCSECSSPMKQEHRCSQCGAEIAPGVRFCPEYGAKQ